MQTKIILLLNLFIFVEENVGYFIRVHSSYIQTYIPRVSYFDPFLILISYSKANEAEGKLLHEKKK